MSWDLIIYVCLTAGAGLGLAFTSRPEERGDWLFWGTVGYCLLLAAGIVFTTRMGWTL